MRILKQGDTGEAICGVCRERVSTTYEYRPVHLERSGVDVEVLVGVCDSCDAVASIPAQSAPRLKEATESRDAIINARIPRHLDDVLSVLASQYSAPSRAFSSMLIRYYFHVLVSSEPFARRVERLSRQEVARGKAEARVSVRVSEALWDDAWSMAREVGVRNRSDLLRGLILAAFEDSTTDRAPARRRVLGEMAAVA